MAPYLFQTMKVKKVTISEKKTTTFLVPDHLEVNGKTMEEIRQELTRITETTEPLILEDQDTMDTSVSSEQIDGILMDRFREHYSQFKY